MNKKFLINCLMLVFSFSALAVKPNAFRKNTKHNPISTQKKLPKKQTDTIAHDEETETPTIGESWSKVLHFKWRSLSKDDAWNIGLSVFTCGVLAYLYHHAPKNSKTNAVNPPDNPGPDNSVKNNSSTHTHKPTMLSNNANTTDTNNNAEQRACAICFDDKPTNEFCTLSCCGHNTACTECLTEVIDLSLKQKSSTGIICPNPNCKKPLSEHDVHTITHAHPELHTAYHNVTTKEWLDNNTKNCPTPNCTFAFVDDEGNQQEFRCPQCNHTYCSNCLTQHSMKVSCAEAERTKDKTKVAQADEEWKKEHSKKCPKCKASIEKNEGCNHMTCKCRHEFCWVCLGRWKTCNCPMFPEAQNNTFNNNLFNDNGQYHHFNWNNGNNNNIFNDFNNGLGGINDLLNFFTGNQPNNNRPVQPVQPVHNVNTTAKNRQTNNRQNVSNANRRTTTTNNRVQANNNARRNQRK